MQSAFTFSWSFFISVSAARRGIGRERERGNMGILTRAPYKALLSGHFSCLSSYCGPSHPFLALHGGYHGHWHGGMFMVWEGGGRADHVPLLYLLICICPFSSVRYLMKPRFLMSHSALPHARDVGPVLSRGATARPIKHRVSDMDLHRPRQRQDDSTPCSLATRAHLFRHGTRHPQP
jgi:hypothetical protein